jgi:hypothetical protein
MRRGGRRADECVRFSETLTGVSNSCERGQQAILVHMDGEERHGLEAGVYKSPYHTHINSQFHSFGGFSA